MFKEDLLRAKEALMCSDKPVSSVTGEKPKAET